MTDDGFKSVTDDACFPQYRQWPHLKDTAARTLAFKVLYRVLEEEGYTNLSIQYYFSEQPVPARERSFAAAMIYGTVAYLVPIDFLLQKALSKPLKMLQPAVRTVLRLSVWQIHCSYSSPVPAVVDEACKLVRKVANEGAVRLVNAVLRKVAAEPWTFPNRPVGLSWGLIPELAGLFVKWFGKERTDSIMRAFDEPAPLTVRLRSDFDFENNLASGTFEAKEAAFMPSARTILLKSGSVEDLPGFADGKIYVQGEGAMLAGHLVAGEPGQRVLDICAAPGGKSFYAADQVGPTGTVIARDNHPSRVELIRENAQRLRLNNVEAQLHDATIPKAEDAYAFDRVIADVPCSGLGQLANRPELRWRMSYEQIQVFPPLQLSILKVAAQAVRLGGRLIYSTCTVNPQENESVVAEFLAEYESEFSRVDISTLLPQKLLDADPLFKQTAINGEITLLPDAVNCEGFYIAVMERKAI